MGALESSYRTPSNFAFPSSWRLDNFSSISMLVTQLMFLPSAWITTQPWPSHKNNVKLTIRNPLPKIPNLLFICMLDYQISFGNDKSLIRVSSAWFRALFRLIILLNWGSTGANRVAMMYCRGAPRIDYIYIGEFSHLWSSARCHHYPTTYMLPLCRVKVKASSFFRQLAVSDRPPSRREKHRLNIHYIIY